MKEAARRRKWPHRKWRKLPAVWEYRDLVSEADFMKAYAQPIKRLIIELGKLPGIGEKTASRLANYILRATEDDVKKLAESIIEVKRKIKFCRNCLNLTETDVCHICHDKTRDHTVICVVEEPD